MQAGELAPEVVAAKQKQEEAEHEVHKQFRRKHHNDLVHKLQYLKRTYTPPMPMPPSKGKSAGSKQQNDDDGNLIYSKDGGGLQRRRGVPGRKGVLEEGGEVGTGRVVAKAVAKASAKAWADSQA